MAKIIIPLNSKQIDNAKPKEKSYSLFDGGGLYMEVSQKGSTYRCLANQYQARTVERF